MLHQKQLLGLLDPNVPTPKGSLAVKLSISSVVLEQTIAELQGLGTPLFDEHGQVTLTAPIALLSAEDITLNLSPIAAEAISEIDVLWETDSTNQRVLERWSDAAGAHGYACIAEFQRHGRGRLGRTWQAPLGGSICLSLGWGLNAVRARHCGQISTGIGVAVIRALRSLAVEHVQLKWPNDIYVKGHKLGGILIETRPCAQRLGVAIGVGLNIDVRSINPGAIEQAYTDLRHCLTCVPPRNRIAAHLLNEMINVMQLMEGDQYAALHAEWCRYDACLDRRVRIQQGPQSYEGIARGIDSEGGLLLQLESGIQNFTAGDVSLREAP